MFVCHFSGLKRAAWLRTCVRIVLVLLTLEPFRPPTLFTYPPPPLGSWLEIFTGHQFSFTIPRKSIDASYLTTPPPWWILAWTYHRFVVVSTAKARLFIAVLFLLFDRSESLGFASNKIRSVEHSSARFCPFRWAIFDIYFFYYYIIFFYIIPFHRWIFLTNDVITSLGRKISKRR